MGTLGGMRMGGVLVQLVFKVHRCFVTQRAVAVHSIVILFDVVEKVVCRGYLKVCVWDGFIFIFYRDSDAVGVEVNRSPNFNAN